MTLDEPSYRDHFAGPARATAYEREQYDSRSYSSALWRIEQAQLASLVVEFRRSHERIDYLDFACGTGRILSFLQPRVDSATGIEISEAMAGIARERALGATIVCRDITAPDAAIEGTYDLITAFRFVLNAEPCLRLAGLTAAAARLRDETSWLVFNNHGNLWSHKLLLYPVHRLRHLGQPRREGNYLTHREVLELADAAGLRIERVLGCGVIGGRLGRLMDFERVVARETRLAASFASRFGSNLMYVARRR